MQSMMLHGMRAIHYVASPPRICVVANASNDAHRVQS